MRSASPPLRPTTRRFYMPQRARRVLHKSPGRRRESLLKLYSSARRVRPRIFRVPPRSDIARARYLDGRSGRVIEREMRSSLVDSKPPISPARRSSLSLCLSTNQAALLGKKQQPIARSDRRERRIQHYGDTDRRAGENDA